MRVHLSFNFTLIFDGMCRFMSSRSYKKIKPSLLMNYITVHLSYSMSTLIWNTNNKDKSPLAEMDNDLSNFSWCL